MYEEPKSFPVEATVRWPVAQAQARESCSSLVLPKILPLAATFALIEAALWTPVGVLGTVWILFASLCIVLSLRGDGRSAKELGLVQPEIRSSAWILLAAAALSPTIPLASLVLGYYSAPAFALSSWQAPLYAVWSVLQEFILQSFFFLQLESLLGGRRAVWAAALLFGAVHLPSPVLTVGAFLGGLFFCEMFRRYRSLVPVGLAHAMLGLTIAASFPDSMLHHMRVGEAYLSFHP